MAASQIKGIQMNVAAWIEKVQDELEAADLHFGHGTDNAGDEAAWLVLHSLGAELDGSFQDWERQPSEDEAAIIQARLDSRLTGSQPLAYILGTAWFAGLEFEVSPAVLVPRSPIGELVIEQFSPWMKASSIGSVLDLCTGCGCIGISVAVYLPWARVDATDISSAALKVARRNVNKHNVAARVQLLQSDLFAALGGRRYDLVLSNPPYVAAETMLDLPSEYRSEPEIGLVSGADGLDACLQILLQAPGYMTDSALLVCEVGESEHRLTELLPSVPFLWLEFSHGGSGVFMLSRQQLLDSATAIGQVTEERRHVA